MKFVAFDVETPNRFSNRMSAIGINVIEDGIISQEYFTYINPEQPFDYFNTQLTGIDENTVAYSPTFDMVWDELEPIMNSGLLVAHNAAFDMSVLAKCLDGYGICWKKDAHYICTVQMGRALLPGISHKLNDLCDYYGIKLNHHRADSDAHACAEVLLRYLDSGAEIKPFIRTKKFY